MEKEDICKYLEMIYLKQNNISISEDNSIPLEFIPMGWYSNFNYELKIKILVDVIENNIKITESKIYLEEFLDQDIKVVYE